MLSWHDFKCYWILFCQLLSPRTFDQIHLSCISVACQLPPAIDIGSFLEQTNGTTSSAVYRCPLGYSLNGSQELKCKDDGSWDVAAPVCGKCQLSHVMRLWYFLSSVKLVLQTCMCSHPLGLDVLFFGWTLRLLPYFMCANSEGSGETARMRRLAWAFAGRLCAKYYNLMSWLNCSLHISVWNDKPV